MTSVEQSHSPGENPNIAPFSAYEQQPYRDYLHQPTDEHLHALVDTHLEESTSLEDLLILLERASQDISDKKKPQRKAPGTQIFTLVEQKLAAEPTFFRFIQYPDNPSYQSQRTAYEKIIQAVAKETAELRSTHPNVRKFLKSAEYALQRNRTAVAFFSPPPEDLSLTSSSFDQILQTALSPKDNYTADDATFRINLDNPNSLVAEAMSENPALLVDRSFGGVTLRNILNEPDDETRNKSTLKYLGSLPHGDYFMGTFAKGLFLLPLSPVEKIDPPLGTAEAEQARRAICFQEWLAKHMVIPALEVRQPDPEFVALFTTLGNNPAIATETIGKAIYTASLYGTRTRELMGVDGEPSEIHKKLIQGHRGSLPPEMATKLAKGVLVQKLGEILTLWSRWYMRSTKNLTTMQRGFYEFGMKDGDQLYRDESSEPGSQTHAQAEAHLLEISQRTTLPKGSYFTTDIPPEFRDAATPVFHEPRERKAHVEGPFSGIERLRFQISTEKGRALEALNNLFFAYLEPDAVIVPEVALDVSLQPGTDGQFVGKHRIRADGVVCRVDFDTGEVKEVVSVIESKWGMALDNIAHSLQREAPHFRAPPFQNAKHLVMRLMGDATAEDIPLEPASGIAVHPVTTGEINDGFLFRQQLQTTATEHHIYQLKSADLLAAHERYGEPVAVMLQLAQLQQQFDRLDAEEHALYTMYKEAGDTTVVHEIEEKLKTQLETFKAMQSFFYTITQQTNAMTVDDGIPKAERTGRKRSYIEQHMHEVKGFIDARNPELMIEYMKEHSGDESSENMLNFIVGNKIFRRAFGGKGKRSADVTTQTQEIANREAPRTRLESDVLQPEVSNFLTHAINSEAKLLVLVLLEQEGSLSKDSLIKKFAELQGTQRKDMKFGNVAEYCTTFAKYGIVTIENGAIQLTPLGRSMAGAGGHILDLSQRYGRNLELTTLFGYANRTGVELGKSYDVRPARTYQLFTFLLHTSLPTSIDEVRAHMDLSSRADIQEIVEQLGSRGILKVEGDVISDVNHHHMIDQLCASLREFQQDLPESSDYTESGIKKGIAILNDTTTTKMLIDKAYRTSAYTAGGIASRREIGS